MNARLLTWTKMAVLLVAAVWVYSAAWNGGWVWDDTAEILNNAPIRGPWSGVGRMWWAPSGADYFPLKETMQWFEWHLWGDRPLGYHLVSLGLHLTSALLFWRLLVRLRVTFAWTAALCFLIHPLAVESVAWIAELKNTLSLPLLLVSALAFVRSAHRADTGRSGRGDYFLSLGCFLAAGLAKSSVVMFPVVLLLFGWFRRRRIVAQDVVATLPYFAISAGIGAATLWFQENRAIAGLVAAAPSLAARVAVAGHAILFYFEKSVWPLGISPVYPEWNVATVSPVDFAPWLLIFLVAGFAWWRRATWGRPALLALGWFALNLAPILGFVRMSFARIAPVSDHFAYISLLGVIAGLAAGLGLIERRARAAGPGVKRAGAVVMALVLVLFAGESRGLARHYRSDRAFWEFASERNPAAWAPHNNLGLMLLAEGKPADAAREFQAVIDSGVRQAEIFNNLGDADVKLQRYPEAIASFQAALSLQPGYPVAEANLGNVYAQIGRYPEAVAHLRRSLELKPLNSELHTHLGLVYSLSGQSQLALPEYREAIREDPAQAEPHYRLGSLLANAGGLPEALAEYAEAIRLNPVYAEAYAEQGLALTLSHRPAEALGPLATAARLKPESVETQEYLGFALSALGRNAEAVAAYQNALRLGGKGGDLYYNLGVALRQLGRVNDAREAFRQADLAAGH